MFCSKCGKKIEDDTKFCPYCGSPVTDSNVGHIEGVVKTENKNQNRKNTIVGIIVICLVVFLLFKGKR